jgi:hypothetical protein
MKGSPVGDWSKPRMGCYLEKTLWLYQKKVWLYACYRTVELVPADQSDMATTRSVQPVS